MSEPTCWRPATSTRHSPVDYVAARDTDKAVEDRGTYRVLEDTVVLHGKIKADPALHLRRVFVRSSARAGAAQKARAKKLDRARDDLERLGRGLGGRYYRTEKQVAERIAVIAKQRRVTAYLNTTVGTDLTTSKPTFAWHSEQAAIEAEAATDGWYALLTNLPPTSTPPECSATTKAKKHPCGATTTSKAPSLSPPSS